MDKIKFPGFKSNYKKDFWKYPIILQNYWSTLTGAEQKALDFILRQTIGFQKTSDKISMSQFVSGIGTKNKGAGISKSQVPRVLKTLQEKGFIAVTKCKFKTNEISLVLEEETCSEDKQEIIIDYKVNEIIEHFRPIAYHRISSFKKDKRQIEAVKILLENYTEEELKKIIRNVEIANGKRYAPTITSPVDLELKLPQLIAFIKKRDDPSYRIVF